MAPRRWIGIIVVLISILLPALNKARRAALAAKCLSQENQFYKATRTWLNDHPRQRSFSSSTGWVASLTRYVKDARIFVCPEDDPSGSPGRVPTRVALPLAIQVLESGEIIGLAPSPRVISPAPGYPNGPNYYTLGIEDLPPPDSEMDFNDLILKVAQNPDGSQVVSILSVEGDRTALAGGSKVSYGWNQDDGAYAVSGKILALDYYHPNADGRDARIFRLQYNALYPSTKSRGPCRWRI